MESEPTKRLEERNEQKSKAIALRIAGLKYEDIARELNMSIDTIKSWFIRGNSKTFSKMLYQAVVSRVLSNASPKALKIVEEELETLPGKYRYRAALALLETVGKMYQVINKPEKEEDGGKTTILAQFNILTTELASRSADIARRVLAREQEEHKIVDAEGGEVK